MVVAAAIYMTRLPWTRAERAGWSELGRLEQQEACSIEGSLFDWSPLRNGQEVRVLQIPVQIGCWRGIKLLDGMQYCMEGLLQGPRPWYCYDGLIWHPTLYLRQVGHVDVLLLLWPGPKRDDGALTATSTYYRIEDTSTMLWTLEEAWNTMNGQAWRSLRYDRSRKDPVYSIERPLHSLPYYRLATATSME